MCSNLLRHSLFLTLRYKFRAGVGGGGSTLGHFYFTPPPPGFHHILQYYNFYTCNGSTFYLFLF